MKTSSIDDSVMMRLNAHMFSYLYPILAIFHFTEILPRQFFIKMKNCYYFERLIFLKCFLYGIVVENSTG